MITRLLRDDVIPCCLVLADEGEGGGVSSGDFGGGVGLDLHITHGSSQRLLKLSPALQPVRAIALNRSVCLTYAHVWCKLEMVREFPSRTTGSWSGISSPLHGYRIPPAPHTSNAIRWASARVPATARVMGEVSRPWPSRRLKMG